MEQGTEAWFKARLGKVTASKLNDVMAVLKSGGEAASRKNYRTQLVIERMTDWIEADGYKNAAMQWGTDTEPLARMAYMLHTGNDVVEVGFVEHETLQAGASPDGLVGNDGLIEIKCPNSANHLETLLTAKPPTQYYAQMQGQMWITGRKWCDFVSYDPRVPEHLQLFVKRIDRDDKYIAELEAGVILFLSEVDRILLDLGKYEPNN